MIKPGMKISVSCKRRPPATLTVTRWVRPGRIGVRTWAFGKEYMLRVPPDDGTLIIPIHQ